MDNTQQDFDLLSYSEIYKQLLVEEEIILVIDAIEEANLRRRLTVLKSKDTAKMRENGVEDSSRLEFIPVNGDDLKGGQIRLHIALKGPGKVKVYDLKAADGSLT